MHWERKDGSTVSSIPGIRQVRPDNSLVFFPIDSNKYRPDVHATVYRCVATNKVGTIRSNDVTVKTGNIPHYSVHVMKLFALHFFENDLAFRFKENLIFNQKEKKILK